MNHLLPEFWQRPDILAHYGDRVDFPELTKLRTERWEKLLRAHWQPFRELLSTLPGRSSLRERGDYEVLLNQAFVQFGSEESLSSEEKEILSSLLKLLIPWRKGPFSVCGIEVDAEWRSDYKWDRIKPFLPKLTNAQVLDIGCSNGYYMFRALEHNPWSILGIDPSEKFLFAFEMFQRLGHFSKLQYELLGIEELGIFKQLFDVVFCFGILYHHRDPLSLLRTVSTTMKPGAEILIESQAIPGDDPVALCPPERYAKARNVYFIPTAKCIESWLLKSGFCDVEIHSSVTLGLDEQRRTDWMQFESLGDFLDPENPELTIEGFAAPLRVILKAKRRK
ncbi:UNVERIFIED_CONTAM: hypothetical protein GTU68_066939 [Idotea baltica]|nr:hypothetical protein [Idotea baltica]